MGARGVLGLGLLGPAILLGSFAWRFELGFDAPWYVLELVAIGYVPLPAIVIALGWFAAAGQLAAIATGRYAPYPDARERRPAGRSGSSSAACSAWRSAGSPRSSSEP